MNCGEDADTTGAIAGMLGGALYGMSAIPKRWLDKLDPHVISEIRLQVDELLRLSAYTTPISCSLLSREKNW